MVGLVRMAFRGWDFPILPPSAVRSVGRRLSVLIQARRPKMPNAPVAHKKSRML